MEWWWMALTLVVALWLAGNGRMQARGPGLWLWVILASCVPGVHPCLSCFGSPISWAKVCHEMTGALVNEQQHQRCLEDLGLIMAPLNSITVGAGQREALQKIVMDSRHFLDMYHHLKPFKESLQEAIDMIFEKLRQLEEAPACVPPCGYQPAARRFQCATCRLVDCRYPVDCPVQDMQAREDETITVNCDVPFATPPDLPVTWMFAKDVRTQDLALFEEIKESAERALILNLQDATSGTIACQLGNLSEPVARKYFYVKVSGRNVKPEQGLQDQFGAVLRWPDVWACWNRTVWLALELGLALVFMAFVLLLVAIWQFRRRPNVSDP